MTDQGFRELLRDAGVLYFILVPGSIALMLLREAVSDWRLRRTFRRNMRSLRRLIGEDES